MKHLEENRGNNLAVITIEDIHFIVKLEQAEKFMDILHSKSDDNLNLLKEGIEYLELCDFSLQLENLYEPEFILHI